MQVTEKSPKLVTPPTPTPTPTHPHPHPHPKLLDTHTQKTKNVKTWLCPKNVKILSISLFRIKCFNARKFLDQHCFFFFKNMQSVGIAQTVSEVLRRQKAHTETFVYLRRRETFIFTLAWIFLLRWRSFCTKKTDVNTESWPNG